MKCNHCKNPVKEQDVICEWCGREISLFQSNDDMHPVNKFEQELREIESKAREKISRKNRQYKQLTLRKGYWVKYLALLILNNGMKTTRKK